MLGTRGLEPELVQRTLITLLSARLCSKPAFKPSGLETEQSSPNHQQDPSCAVELSCSLLPSGHPGLDREWDHAGFRLSLCSRQAELSCDPFGL